MDQGLVRQQVLAVVAKIIAKDGADAVQIRDVCRKTKKTAPTIYRLFGNREQLIAETQAYRFSYKQRELIDQFSNRTYLAKSRAEFIKIAHASFEIMLSEQRQNYRKMRVEVLGAAMSDKTLATRIDESIKESARLGAPAIKYAQAHGWISDNFDAETFIAYIPGISNARANVELTTKNSLRNEWDKIAVRSLCLLIGIPEPKNAKRKKIT
jgi:AcrR family transcriptional regulator